MQLVYGRCSPHLQIRILLKDIAYYENGTINLEVGSEQTIVLNNQLCPLIGYAADNGNGKLQFSSAARNFNYGWEKVLDIKNPFPLRQDF